MTTGGASTASAWRQHKTILTWLGGRAGHDTVTVVLPRPPRLIAREYGTREQCVSKAISWVARDDPAGSNRRQATTSGATDGRVTPPPLAPGVCRDCRPRFLPVSLPVPGVGRRRKSRATRAGFEPAISTFGSPSSAVAMGRLNFKMGSRKGFVVAQARSVARVAPAKAGACGDATKTRVAVRSWSSGHLGSTLKVPRRTA